MQWRQVVAWCTCASFAAVGVILITNTRPRIPPTLPAPSSAGQPQAIPSVASLVAVPRVPPTWITIPAIGVSAPIAPEGLDSTGALQLPPLTEPNLAAWWSGGPAPGQDGAAVIAGHVDSAQLGPLVFWKLRDLRIGDRIDIRPGLLIFTVTQITQVSKTAFPTLAVYGPAPGPQLRLITCGGPFDQATGHYFDNIIVYARLTVVNRRRR